MTKKSEPRKEFYFIRNRKERDVAYAQYLSKKPPSFKKQLEVIEVSVGAQKLNEKMTLANKLAYGYVKEIKLKNSTSFSDVINFMNSLNYDHVDYFQEASVLNLIINNSERVFKLIAYNTVNGYFIIKYQEAINRQEKHVKIAKKPTKKIKSQSSKTDNKSIEHKEFDSSSKHNKLVALYSPHSVPAPNVNKPKIAKKKYRKRNKVQH